MGTNFYFHEKQPCPHCGRGFDSRHIGKSSMGWCFSLHVYPEEGINGLDDWKRLWATPGSYIKNEYGEVESVEAMIACITERGPRDTEKKPFGYSSWESFHAENGSMNGPNGMLRHRLDRHCVGHGEGTWDLLTGEFS